MLSDLATPLIFTTVWSIDLCKRSIPSILTKLSRCTLISASDKLLLFPFCITSGGHWLTVSPITVARHRHHLNKMDHNAAFSGVPANGGPGSNPMPFANGTPPAGDMSAVPPPSTGGSQDAPKTTLW
jgi:hypothetical protein